MNTITSTNSTTADYSHDNTRRLSEVWNKQGANTISEHTYTLDALGNRTQAAELLPRLITSPTTRWATIYGYDRLSRLTSVTQTGIGSSGEGIRLGVINQLRTDVDAWRQAAGLPAYAWTDPTLTTSTPVRDDHFLELRNALRDIPGQSGLQYSAGDPAPTRPVKQSDLNDLRQWVYGDEQPTTYGYDPVGNRLSMTRGISTTTNTYDRADRLTAAGSTSYTVNANGNLTARGSDAFGYDQANRLKTATVGGATSTYVYDGDGKRASKTVGGSTTSYVYDPNRSLPVVLDDGRRKYVWGFGLACAVHVTGTASAYHTDGLGSVQA